MAEKKNRRPASETPAPRERDSGLTHLDSAGEARMVDVSAKPKVRRTARAACTVRLAPTTIALLREARLAKGDVLAVARVAGIMAAKRTSDLIPLCHGIEIDQVTVEFNLGEDHVFITTTAVCVDKTGIEMEALTAAGGAALTIWDMCKAVDKEMRIDGLVLLEKTKEGM